MPQGVKVNISGFGIDALNELEHISNVNLISYYKTELDKLDRGLHYNIKICSRRMFYKRDIIYYNHTVKRTCLTPKGKNYLDIINLEEKEVNK